MVSSLKTVGLLKKAIFNSIKGVDFLARRRFNLGITPTFLWFEATSQCNARCIHCNIWRAQSSPLVLSPQDIETTLSDSLFRNLKVVVVSGGEPTMRADLKEIVICIHRVKPDAVIVINSNAILEDRLIEAASLYLDRGGILHIGISVDGIAESHDRLRGVKGLFLKTQRVLNKLIVLKKTHGERLGISVGFVLSDLTVDALIPVKRYTETIGVEFNLQWYNDAFYYENTGEKRLTRLTEIEAALRSFPPSIINERGMSQLQNRSIRFSCFSMYNFCVLKSNGDLVPCFRMWNCKIGNIKENTPAEIWKCTQANSARDQVKRCAGCLFTCAQQWSFEASFFPRLFFLLQHPGLLLKKILAG